MHPTLLVSAPNSVNAGERHLRSFLRLRVADCVYNNVTIELGRAKRLLAPPLTSAPSVQYHTRKRELERFGKGL